MTSNYPRTARILTPKAYKHVFESGQKIKQGGLFCYVCKNQTQDPRLGLAISKKSFSNAVVRNRIKRIVRECFRLGQNELPGVDIVVIVKYLPKKTDVSYARPAESVLSPWMGVLRDRLFCA